MTTRSVTHSSFTIDRTYDASPARVYAAWSKPEAKAAWFNGPPGQWTQLVREHDFRVGGSERVRGQFPNGKTSDFQCHYLDIVPEQRIVYAYDMFVDDQKISVSLATIELVPSGTGTRLIVTEQGAFFGPPDDPANRERGTIGLMEQLAASLRD